jgi:hypothetical protein
VLLSPLTACSRETAFAIWMVANGAALVVSLAVISRTLSLGGWAVASMAALIYASPGMFAMLMTGQVAGVLLLPYTLGWWQARRGHHVKASWWLGVCASVKPLFLLFAPAMALAGRWRAAAVLAATVLLVFAGGVAVYGLDSHRLWVNNLRAVTWAEHYMNASLLGLVERSLSATAWRYRPVVDAAWMVMPIWAIAAGGVTFATLWRVRMIADVDRQFLLLTTAALLVSPLSWVYYLWFLIPALTAHLASSPAHDRKCRTALVLGLACLLAPLPWVSAAETWRAGLGTPTFGSIYCWGLVALWTSAWREPTATDVTRPRTSIE